MRVRLFYFVKEARQVKGKNDQVKKLKNNQMQPEDA